MQTGLVVSFFEEKGFGFIREEGAPEGHLGTIFFHHSDVLRLEGRYIGVEQVMERPVEFELEVTTEGRHRARNIRVVDNAGTTMERETG